jgi:hypothetical protein
MNYVFYLMFSLKRVPKEHTIKHMAMAHLRSRPSQPLPITATSCPLHHPTPHQSCRPHIPRTQDLPLARHQAHRHKCASLHNGSLHITDTQPTYYNTLADTVQLTQTNNKHSLSVGCCSCYCITIATASHKVLNHIEWATFSTPVQTCPQIPPTLHSQYRSVFQGKAARV